MAAADLLAARTLLLHLRPEHPLVLPLWVEAQHLAMKQALLVGGTHSFHADPARNLTEWYAPSGPFAREVLIPAGIGIVAPDARPYIWDGALDGVVGDDLTWMAWGQSLYNYVVPPLAPEKRIAPEDLIGIGHSAGGHIWLHAAAYGLKIECLVTVGTPIRHNMQHILDAARPNIRRHLHIYSKRDWWQIFGSIGDRWLGICRIFPEPTWNQEAPGGHGGVLREQELFPLWQTRNWLKYMLDDDTATSLEVLNAEVAS